MQRARGNWGLHQRAKSASAWRSPRGVRWPIQQGQLCTRICGLPWVVGGSLHARRTVANVDALSAQVFSLFGIADTYGKIASRYLFQ